MSELVTDALLEKIVQAAGAAPSIHNSQPWHFSADADAISLHAIADRALCVCDPLGRALYISCGAALFNARLCLRMASLTPQVRLLPHPDYPFDVLALIRAVRGPPPTAAERELYDAIPRRRTNRQPYSDRHIPHGVRQRLREAAEDEHAALYLPDIEQAAELLVAAERAGRELARDGAHQAELEQWIGAGRDDGIPLEALPSRPDQLPAPVRVDDFRTAAPAAPLTQGSYELFPQLAVLTTHGDDPEDWLVAGQALQRVLLAATASGLSASFLYQAIELRDMTVSDAAHWPAPPNTQMIIRLGYASAPSADPPALHAEAGLRGGSASASPEQVSRAGRWPLRLRRRSPL